jgi:hypothetical protein
MQKPSNLQMVIAVDNGIIGMIFSALSMLIVRLVVIAEPFRGVHAFILIISLLGFMFHVYTSRKLLQNSRDAGDKLGVSVSRK